MEQHRRIRRRQELERQKAKRGSYDRILIVCEGEKTEPQYFEEIRKHFKLSTANVQIVSSDYGTTPQQVVNFALDEIKEKRRPEYEKVFCVFDRDNHPNFNNALKSATANDKKYKNDLGEPISFIAIPSIPCFELWFLLHYEYVTKELTSAELLKHLNKKKYLPEYNKGKKGYFSHTRDKLSDACENSKKLKKERKVHNNSNPSTEVDQLVETLLDLK